MGTPVRELDLLAHIRREGARLPNWVKIKPGDDLALVADSPSNLLVGADQLIEGRHFVTGTPWELVARKAIARNVSDVAAMAALPMATLATVAAPKGFQQARELFDALNAAAQRLNCPLIGGDYATQERADVPLVISVSILARPRADGRVLERKGARAGDLLVATGRLGGSLGPHGLGRHLTFQPRVAEAQALCDWAGARLHALIDLSDGLGIDAGRLAEASGLQAVIDAALLPTAEACDWKRALSDGEDYELLAALAAPAPDDLAGTRVSVVGMLREIPAADSRRCVVLSEGRELDASAHGWQHG